VAQFCTRYTADALCDHMIWENSRGWVGLSKNSFRRVCETTYLSIRCRSVGHIGVSSAPPPREEVAYAADPAFKLEIRAASRVD
jgi:hypothetical protein